MRISDWSSDVCSSDLLPLLDVRRADIGADQGHGAGPALVLPAGGDLPRIRRPHQDRLVGVLPAGVVGGVTVVLHADGGELLLLAGCGVAHPLVPDAAEGPAGLAWPKPRRFFGLRL